MLADEISPEDYVKIVGCPDRLDLNFLKILRKPYQSLDYAAGRFAECLPEHFSPEERLNETLQLFTGAADLPYWELKQADAMYMAFSKEVRVPFLDNDLFDLASKLRSSLKWFNQREKYVLREALRPYLPASIIDRKKFPSLGTPSRFYNEPWCTERVRRLTDRENIWDPSTMNRYLKGELNGPPDPDVVYRFIVIDQWLREYGIN